MEEKYVWKCSLHVHLGCAAWNPFGPYSKAPCGQRFSQSHSSARSDCWKNTNTPFTQDKTWRVWAVIFNQHGRCGSGTHTIYLLLCCGQKSIIVVVILWDKDVVLLQESSKILADQISHIKERHHHQCHADKAERCLQNSNVNCVSDRLHLSLLLSIVV